MKLREKSVALNIGKTEKINEIMSCFFEKINKIDKSLSRLTKNKREKTNS